jgi:hypothetical protein
MERGWGLSTPPAKAMIEQSPLGISHHYSASRHATHVNTILESTVTTFELKTERSSAYERFFRVKYRGDSLYCYGAPIRYVIDETLRDSKFDQSAEAAYYVGVSPENSSAIWCWTGTRHVTVGGSHKVDECKYWSRAVAKHEKLPHWPEADPGDSAVPVVAPVAQPIVQRTTVVLRAGYDPIPIGSVLDVGYTQADGSMVRWRGTVAGSSPKPGGKQYTRFDWGDPKWAQEESSKRGIDLTLESHPFWVISLANVDGDTSLPDDVGDDQPVVVVPAESTRHQVVDLLKQHVAATAVLPIGSTQLGAPTAVGDVSMAARRHTRSVPGQVSSGLKAMRAVECKRYLVMFAGPRCKDSVASALRDLGASDGDEVDEVDIVQGGLAHNLSKFPNQSALLERVHNREFAGIAMAPPCRSFAVILHPWRRTQTHVDGVPGLSVAERASVDSDTSLAVYCAVVALAANAVGTPWLIEQPAFRGDAETMAHWKGCEDAPHMFQLREFQVLLRVAKPVQVVFPQCALDADSQKFTVLLGARSLTNALSPFRALQCTHTSHAEVLEGIGADGAPRTRAAAHYPMRMARLIAKVLRNASAWVSEQQRSSDEVQLPSFGEVVATAPAAPPVPPQVVWPDSVEQVVHQQKVEHNNLKHQRLLGMVEKNQRNQSWC